MKTADQKQPANEAFSDTSTDYRRVRVADSHYSRDRALFLVKVAAGSCVKALGVVFICLIYLLLLNKLKLLIQTGCSKESFCLLNLRYKSETKPASV